MTAVDRRSNLSYREFASEYLFANKPVVITDALRNWPAVGKWTPEFFKSEFADTRFSLNEDRNQGASYNENLGNREYTMPEFIDQVLASSDSAPAPYFRNRILKEVFPALEKDIQPLPDYFFPNWLPENFVVGSVRENLNRGAATEIYIGGKGGSFPVLHYDGAAVHAFLMQIYGTKEFIVFDPAQEKYLYPNPERKNLSLVRDINNPDLQKFPLFANAKPIKFIAGPGDLVFVPSMWWHTTKMLSASITISVNVVNESNWSNLVEFVASRRKNPLVSIGSRLYLNVAGAWRSRRDKNWQPAGSRNTKSASASV